MPHFFVGEHPTFEKASDASNHLKPRKNSHPPWWTAGKIQASSPSKSFQLKQLTRFSIIDSFSLALSQIRPTKKINLPENQKGYNESETIDENISAKSIQIFQIYFSVISFWSHIFKQVKTRPEQRNWQICSPSQKFFLNNIVLACTSDILVSIHHFQRNLKNLQSCTRFTLVMRIRLAKTSILSSKIHAR